MESKETVHDVIVLGAGIAGLTVAYRARQAGKSVRLFEKSSRAGGPIRSERVDGYLLEHGPSTVLPREEIMSLVQHLDLDDKLLFSPPGLPRFVRFHGKLRQVPTSPAEFLASGLLSVPGRLRVLIEPLVRRRKNGGDETLLAFARRRLGAEAAERLVAPLVSGVWAGDAGALSAGSAFPSLRDWEKRYGSLAVGAVASRRSSKKTSAPKRLMSFYDGLETLPRAIAQALSNEITLNAPATELRPGPVWTVRAGDHEAKGRSVVVTVPAFEAAPLVAPFAADAALALGQIPYAPVAVLHLGIPADRVGRAPHGFGYLVVPSEPSDILGCLWSSTLFGGRAPEGRHLLTVIMGGARRPDLAALPENELVARALGDLRDIMKVSGRPDFIRVARHPQGIPQYTVGHADRIETISKAEQTFPGLRFAGNYIAGISVGDVIRHAAALAAGDL
ncbi:MAG: protoporphyrinogen oxidase [Elusimicrobia bacterium]|nr:protoporphyrinogen oxidase [Elusimicrobiota bacterium]